MAAANEPVTAAKGQLRAKGSRGLLAAIDAWPRIAVVMHDNPDPDAIASGWALKVLLEAKTEKPVRLVGGGEIVRAENRHMVELLHPPIELVDRWEFEPDTAAILVDCGPEATNHLIVGEAITPVAVIDHHQPPAAPPGADCPPRPGERAKAGEASTGPSNRRRSEPFVDIRPRVAASASIATTYLREQQLEPGPELATALLYAIRSETRGGETCFSRMDQAVLSWLTQRADPTKLAEIEDAPLRWEYFSDLALALLSATAYGDVAFCMLPHAEGPETVGEVADLLIRCDRIGRVFCAAVYDGAVLISVRTDEEAGNATALLQETIRGLGGGGGHAHRAGGKLTAVAGGRQVPADCQEELRVRWLRVCNASPSRGIPLVSRREIIDNLSASPGERRP